MRCLLWLGCVSFGLSQQPAFDMIEALLESNNFAGSFSPALQATVSSTFYLSGFDQLELVDCTRCPAGAFVKQECTTTTDTVCEFNQCSGVETNPPNSNRIFSSVFGGDQIGVGHGQAMLDSTQAWSAQNNNPPSEFAQIDLLKPQAISHVIVQPRRSSGQHSQV
eukprot:c12706_g1_i2.p1 GENE.c12706_g1_i2~~c12706_g1_i2.p1  ORF type:complete len:165 (+),score=26.87 c12706_g1_i2:178-672(+)